MQGFSCSRNSTASASRRSKSPSGDDAPSLPRLVGVGVDGEDLVGVEVEITLDGSPSLPRRVRSSESDT